MLAEGTAHRASVEHITEAADVGLGSFYNHFTSKDELFLAVVDDVLTETGTLLDQLHEGWDDPVAAYARSVRLSAIGALLRPKVARILVRRGLDYLDTPNGPAAHILRDIEAAVATGRLRTGNPKLALTMTLGSVLATLGLALSDPDFAAQPLAAQLTENLLRMLGLPDDEARRLATEPLPEVLRPGA